MGNNSIELSVPMHQLNWCVELTCSHCSHGFRVARCQELQDALILVAVYQKQAVSKRRCPNCGGSYGKGAVDYNSYVQILDELTNQDETYFLNRRRERYDKTDGGLLFSVDVECNRCGYKPRVAKSIDATGAEVLRVVYTDLIASGARCNQCLEPYGSTGSVKVSTNPRPKGGEDSHGRP